MARRTRDSGSSAFEVFQDVPYTVVKQGGEELTLHCSMHLPKITEGKPPLFAWFHGGAFKGGNHNQKMARVFGRRLSSKGVAFVSAQYRIGGALSDLSPDVAEKFDGYQSHQTDFSRPDLSGAASIVALEDGVRFLAWAEKSASKYGWSDKLILGGSSAGAITSYNIAFGADHLNLRTPRIHGVYSASGSFYYPDFVKPRPDFRSLALHNPKERRVSVEGVRMLKEKLGDQMELLESEDHWHGKAVLSPDERLGVAFDRIAQFVKQATQ